MVLGHRQMPSVPVNPPISSNGLSCLTPYDAERYSLDASERLKNEINCARDLDGSAHGNVFHKKKLSYI